ncbi:MAG TPA: hypothetical protein VMA09_10990 [Candidatus Binataceae bacterium]|nr:hypothetical protein [Candidatus Binataceae bacterium]
MGKASIRDLRYNFPEIERRLQRGETIEITRRKRVIARLEPVMPEVPQMPDFLGRTRAIFGKRVIKPSGAELLARERSRY